MLSLRVQTTKAPQPPIWRQIQRQFTKWQESAEKARLRSGRSGDPRDQPQRVMVLFIKRVAILTIDRCGARLRPQQGHISTDSGPPLKISRMGRRILDQGIDRIVHRQISPGKTGRITDRRLAKPSRAFWRRRKRTYHCWICGFRLGRGTASGPFALKRQNERYTKSWMGI